MAAFRNRKYTSGFYWDRNGLRVRSTSANADGQFAWKSIVCDGWTCVIATLLAIGFNRNCECSLHELEFSHLTAAVVIALASCVSPVMTYSCLFQFQNCCHLSGLRYVKRIRISWPWHVCVYVRDSVQAANKQMRGFECYHKQDGVKADTFPKNSNQIK